MHSSTTLLAFAGLVAGQQTLLGDNRSPCEMLQRFNLTAHNPSNSIDVGSLQIISYGFTVSSLPYPLAHKTGFATESTYYLNSTSLFDGSANYWGLEDPRKDCSHDGSMGCGKYGYVVEIEGETSTGLGINVDNGEVVYHGNKDFESFTLCQLREAQHFAGQAFETQLGWRTGDDEDVEGCMDVKLVATYLDCRR